jgi:hypothetical protein
MKEQKQEQNQIKQPTRAMRRLKMIYRNPKLSKQRPIMVQGQASFDFGAVEQEGTNEQRKGPQLLRRLSEVWIDEL